MGAAKFSEFFALATESGLALVEAVEGMEVSDALDLFKVSRHIGNITMCAEDLEPIPDPKWGFVEVVSYLSDWKEHEVAERIIKKTSIPPRVIVVPNGSIQRRRQARWCS